MKFASNFKNAAQGTQHVDACMLAAIVARESGGQNILQTGMAPGPGCGVGLCQITAGVDWSNGAAPAYPGFGSLLDPDVNLRVAAHAFLDPLLSMFPSNHIAAFAAYNAGPGNVQAELKKGLAPDAWTTGHDYGTDVFTSWINFAAASMGVNVDWAGHQVSAPAAPPSSGPLAPPRTPASVGGPSQSDLGDLSNN
jgi:hypothetical protein